MGHSDVDQRALDELLAASSAAGTTQLHITIDGRPVADTDGHGQPLSIASITKLLVGVTIGRAVKLAGLDIGSPIARWFPAWSADARAGITVRQVMGHVSGLSTGDWASIDAAPPDDLLAAAVDLPLVAKPGTHWAYNNIAVMVLPAIVSQIMGQPFLDFVRAEFFERIGVTEWDWQSDNSGNPFAMATAMLNAADLARVGEVLTDGGAWRGDQLLPVDWVRTCQDSPAIDEPTVGLLAFNRWADAVPDGAPVAIGHTGSGGQQLWCYPASGVTVARLRDNRVANGAYEPATKEQEYAALPHLAARIRT